MKKPEQSSSPQLTIAATLAAGGVDTDFDACAWDDLKKLLPTPWGTTVVTPGVRRGLLEDA